MAENTEKHLTTLCQTLTSQMEDMKLQLRLTEETCKSLESELNSKQDKLEKQSYVLKNSSAESHLKKYIF